jgi:hypothetical protein
MAMTNEKYEAPTIEVVGSVEELTQSVVKNISRTSDGYYLGSVVIPLNS